MMSGGVFFPLRIDILCVQILRRNDRSRDNRGTALRNTNGSSLRSKGGSRLGAHTCLDQTQKGCICLLADIVAVGREGVFMVIKIVL